MPAGQERRRSRRVLAAVVLALIGLLSVVNAKMGTRPLERMARQELDFEEFVEEVHNRYLSRSFIPRNDFLNLGGLFARATGRRTLNRVVKLRGGTLSAPVGEMDPAPMAEGVIGFSDHLRRQGIPFLYVQIPYKESVDGRSFPVGIDSYANANADALLSRLQAGGVETLDLRPVLAQTPDMLKQYFYATDHHWNADGAFVAFGEILGRLDEMLPKGGVELSYAQADHWQRYSIDHWFLGSRGKGVGVCFAGTDPLIWYMPRFKTEMSCAVLNHGWLYRGDFAAANLRPQYIEEKNYFDDSAYCVYIGGDYPLVRHRNAGAPSPLKILLLKDSFTLPLQACLSTVFREVDVIDPRYFSECGVAEYVERTRPDVVLLAVNPDIMEDESYHDFGVEDMVPYGGDGANYDVVIRQDLPVEASENEYNFGGFGLAANTVYRLTFDAVDVLEGQTEGAGLRLYDVTTQTVLENMMFDIAYCRAADGFTWIFRTPDTWHDLRLLFYAGVYGATADNSVVYRNVTLERYVE